MTLPAAILTFDATLAVAVAVDLLTANRRTTAVRPVVPPVAAVVAGVTLAPLVASPAEFVAVAVLVTAGTLFGYANALAFLKRGITFSILLNHQRPPNGRRPDEDFISLDERLDEMRRYGWLVREREEWTLTVVGRRAVRLRQWLLRVLATESVG